MPEYGFMFGGEWKMSEPDPMDGHVSRIPAFDITDGKPLLFIYSKAGDNSLMILTDDDMSSDKNLELVDENVILEATTK